MRERDFLGVWLMKVSFLSGVDLKRATLWKYGILYNNRRRRKLRTLYQETRIKKTIQLFIEIAGNRHVPHHEEFFTPVWAGLLAAPLNRRQRKKLNSYQVVRNINISKGY